MRALPLAAAILAVAALGGAPASGAAATPDPVGGTWLVKGKLVTLDFTLTCKFDRRGDTFGGTCIDPNRNKVHTLDSGVVAEPKVNWAFPVSSTANVTFQAVLDGPRMTGVISMGRFKGDFTATRP